MSNKKDEDYGVEFDKEFGFLSYFLIFNVTDKRLVGLFFNREEAERWTKTFYKDIVYTVVQGSVNTNFLTEYFEKKLYIDSVLDAFVDLLNDSLKLKKELEGEEYNKKLYVYDTEKKQILKNGKPLLYEDALAEEVRYCGELEELGYYEKYSDKRRVITR